MQTGTVARQKEREEKEASVISVTESMSRKSRRNSIASHSHMTQRRLYSGERDLREHLERRAQQDIVGETSTRRSSYSTEQNREIRNQERRKTEFLLFESQHEIESQRRQVLIGSESMGRLSSASENTIVW